MTDEIEYIRLVAEQYVGAITVYKDFSGEKERIKHLGAELRRMTVRLEKGLK